jgi:hypothetical protein
MEELAAPHREAPFPPRSASTSLYTAHDKPGLSYATMDNKDSAPMIRESRRSTRVPLKVVISVEGADHRLTCEGETIVVNLHGALLSTAIALELGVRISIQVYLTGKRAGARVVYVDPQNQLHCGVELDQPRNIWGVSLPPDDWDETSSDIVVR